MPKRLVVSLIVVAAVIVIYVLWRGTSGMFFMHRLVVERERHLLYDIDHKALAAELRKFANEQRWSRRIRNADPDAFGTSNPATPTSLRILKPSAIWIFDDRIQFDCGGPFFDFGIVVFPEGADDRRDRRGRADPARPSEDAGGDAGRSRDVLRDARRPGADGPRGADRRRARDRPLLQHPARRRPRDRGQPANLDDRLPGGSEPAVPGRQARARRDRRRGARRAGSTDPSGAAGAPLLRSGRMGRVTSSRSHEAVLSYPPATPHPPTGLLQVMGLRVTGPCQ